MNLEQIARKAAEEWGLCFDEDGLVRIPQGFHLITFVKEVVAELTKGQEPTEQTLDAIEFAVSVWSKERNSIRLGLFVYRAMQTVNLAAPPICPTAEWQWVPKEPTPEMIAEACHLGPDVVMIYKDMLAAAPEYKL